MIRLRPSVQMIGRADELATIRLPFALCESCKGRTYNYEIIQAVGRDRMNSIIAEAKKKFGLSPNPFRTQVIWIKLTEKNDQEPPHIIVR